MGTSSLYGGPKKTALLPPDYDSEQEEVVNNPDEIIPNDKNDDEGCISQQEQSEDDETKGNNEESSIYPSVSWGTARASMRKAMNDRSTKNVNSVIKNYTKALGGHKNAKRQSKIVLNVANNLYLFFYGTPEAIRKHFEEKGISFEGRNTKEIFSDICNSIAPIPNDLEDSLVNKALRETCADIVEDQSIDLSLLENFNEELLQRLVGGLMKHYIFDKLILQIEQTALKNCDENVANLRDLEKELKLCIDGIVDRVVPNFIKSGITPSDFKRVFEKLCDTSYKLMEDLK